MKMDNETEIALSIRFVKRLSGFERVFVKSLVRKATSDCDCVELTGVKCVFCKTRDRMIKEKLW